MDELTKVLLLNDYCNEEQVSEAIIQSSQQENFFAFCIQKQIFNKTSLFRICNYINASLCSFEQALLKLFGPQFSKELFEIFLAHRKGLLALLEKENILTESLMASIEKPLQEQTETINLQADETSNQELTPPLWQFPPINDSENIDTNLLDDFLESFEEGLKTQIENIIISLKISSAESTTSTLSLVYREFHSLKGSARFSKLNTFEKVTHQLEELISLVQNVYFKTDLNTKLLIEQTLLDGVDILWELKNSIAATRTESAIRENDSWIKAVSQLHQSALKTEAILLQIINNQSKDDLLSRF
jgi:hypothetical protein